MNWFPILLVTHIALAVALLLPSVLLPFVLRRGDGEAGPVTRLLMAAQGTGTIIIAGGLAITGAAMLWILGPELLAQPWLLIALGLYALNLAVAAFVSRPNLRAPGRPAKRRGRRDMVPTRAAPAMGCLRDGRDHRRHRLPHEHQAGAVVTPQNRGNGSGLPITKKMPATIRNIAIAKKSSQRSTSKIGLPFGSCGRQQTPACRPILSARSSVPGDFPEPL